MSSMRALSLVLLLGLTAMSTPAACQDGAEWDQARQRLIAGQRGGVAQGIDRWKVLTSSAGVFNFETYASFLLSLSLIHI